jgi:hypothetical protein
MRKIIVFKFIKFEKELKNVSIIKNMNTNEEKYLRPLLDLYETLKFLYESNSFELTNF